MVHNLVFGMEQLPILVRQGEGKSELADLLQRAQVEPILGCRDPTPGNPGPPWDFVFKYYNRVPVYVHPSFRGVLHKVTIATAEERRQKQRLLDFESIGRGAM
eukprot:9393890-Alexandrium_andersonii.AAC.1